MYIAKNAILQVYMNEISKHTLRMNVKNLLQHLGWQNILHKHIEHSFYSYYCYNDNLDKQIMDHRFEDYEGFLHFLLKNLLLLGCSSYNEVASVLISYIDFVGGCYAEESKLVVDAESKEYLRSFITPLKI